MVKLKCKNCGKIFVKFIDKEEDLKLANCEDCHSHWIVIFEEKPFIPQFIIPKINPDIINPKPHIYPYHPHPDVRPKPIRFGDPYLPKINIRSNLDCPTSNKPIVIEMQLN